MHRYNECSEKSPAYGHTYHGNTNYQHKNEFTLYSLLCLIILRITYYTQLNNNYNNNKYNNKIVNNN